MGIPNDAWGLHVSKVDQAVPDIIPLLESRFFKNFGIYYKQSKKHLDRNNPDNFGATNPS